MAGARQGDQPRRLGEQQRRLDAVPRIERLQQRPVERHLADIGRRNLGRARPAPAGWSCSRRSAPCPRSPPAGRSCRRSTAPAAALRSRPMTATSAREPGANSGRKAGSSRIASTAASAFARSASRQSASAIGPDSALPPRHGRPAQRSGSICSRRVGRQAAADRQARPQRVEHRRALARRLPRRPRSAPPRARATAAAAAGQVPRPGGSSRQVAGSGRGRPGGHVSAGAGSAGAAAWRRWKRCTGSPPAGCATLQAFTARRSAPG